MSPDLTSTPSVEAFRSIRAFAQDCIENGHDRASLGNLYSIRDLCDAAIERLSAPQPREPGEGFDPPVIQAVYTRGGKALVCGRPGTYSNLPDGDERHHNCDAMGCSSIEHVLWRGPLTVDEPSGETGDVISPNYVLPCDVKLPPNTVVGKGCKLSTLMTVLSHREGVHDIPRFITPPVLPETTTPSHAGMDLASGPDRTVYLCRHGNFYPELHGPDAPTCGCFDMKATGEPPATSTDGA